MLLPYLHPELIEAGCDEAGRGCLAGAVYAAAVILPHDFHNELLNDSKQLSEKQRYALREVIEKEAVAWAVGVVTPEEIDKINILNASFADRWKPFQQVSGFASYYDCKRRWKISVDCSGFDSGKNIQGRLHERAARSLSAIRLERQQGVSYSQTSGSHCAIWHYALSPQDFQPAGQRTTFF